MAGTSDYIAARRQARQRDQAARHAAHETRVNPTADMRELQRAAGPASIQAPMPYEASIFNPQWAAFFEALNPEGKNLKLSQQDTALAFQPSVGLDALRPRSR